MAVLGAVRGWEYLAGLPHIGAEENKEEGSDGSEEKEKQQEEGTTEGEKVEEGMWSKEELENGLDGLLDTDYIGLLLEHDEYTTSSSQSSLRGFPRVFCSRILLIDWSTVFDISSYIPDVFLPGYQSLKDTVVDYLELFGIAHGPAEGSAAGIFLLVFLFFSSLLHLPFIAGSTQARKAYDDAEHSLKLTREEKQKSEEEYANLFDPEGFGTQGEWKKLEETCLEKDTGEYVLHF